MNWSDIPRNPTSKVLRQFAAAWLVFFIAWGCHQGFVKGRHELGLALGILGLTFGGVGLIIPPAARGVFVAWMMLAFPIGWAVSLLMLAIMYYLFLTPVALFFRIIGRDPLSRRIDPEVDSYWVAKETPADSRRYFQPY